MTKMRFTINDEFAGVKGLVNCGKQIIDLGADVNNGVIESEVPVVQQTLANLLGKSGRVFRSEIVNDDGSTQDVELQPVVTHAQGRNPAEVAAEMEANKRPQAPDAGTGYEALPVEELTTLIQGHGLPVPTNADKAELVQILEEADAQVK